MIYEYKCSKCDNVEEVSMKMTDEHPLFVLCTKCRGKAPRYFTVSPIVPDHMRAGNEGIDYTSRKNMIHGKKYF